MAIQNPPGFHAPIIDPSASSPQPSLTPAGSTAWYKTALQKMMANKSISLFAAMMLLSAGMGTYIIVAPSSKTAARPAASAFSQVIPTTYPTTAPTPSTSSVPTATPPPAPTENVAPTPTEEPTPTILPTPTTDPTTNWNTYLNTNYGYSIKYPLNWTAINLGELEPKVPSYVVFNMNTASSSARSITISVSTRGYQEQLDINGQPGTAYNIGSITGSWQNLKNSDGDTSVAVTIPRKDTIVIFRAKSAFIPTLIDMLKTLYLSN